MTQEFNDNHTRISSLWLACQSGYITNEEYAEQLLASPVNVAKILYDIQTKKGA